MCGIAGLYSLTNTPVQQDAMQAMVTCLRHRGPDDEGLYFDRRLGLGHNRLSIIDLSPLGHQPMTNEDGTVLLIFNGEIYNYIELIPELKARGHRFRSHSDSEVIIHAYEEYGTDCLQRFNGMWAFAIWDSKKQLLFCARDQYGIKPLYYAQSHETLLFASEIKALLTYPGIKRVPNNLMVYDYLTYGFHDHTEQTFFQGIFQLEPAHYLTAQNGSYSVRKYWEFTPRNNSPIQSNASYAEEFREFFTQSVKIRLRSDVPVGTCLSGGLDSNSIVGMANTLQPLSTAFHAFTAGFSDTRFDERRYIADTLKKIPLQHHVVMPDASLLLAELDNLIRVQDEPFISTSIFAQYEVMKLAHAYRLKVLLDGQGADELLGGYPDYLTVYAATLLRHFALPKLYRNLAASGMHMMGGMPNFLFHFLPNLVTQPVALLLRTHPAYLKKSFAKKYAHLPEMCKFSGQDDATNYLYTSFFKHGLRGLLRYEDRNSMAFSIETRLPFLDQNLVDFALRLPMDQKIHNGVLKFVQRNALKDVIPESILTRKDKMGFVTPESLWLRKELRDTVMQGLGSGYLEGLGYADTHSSVQLFRDFLSGKHQIHHSIIWRLFNLQRWHQLFFA